MRRTAIASFKLPTGPEPMRARRRSLSKDSPSTCLSVRIRRGRRCAGVASRFLGSGWSPSKPTLLTHSNASSWGNRRRTEVLRSGSGFASSRLRRFSPRSLSRIDHRRSGVHFLGFGQAAGPLVAVPQLVNRKFIFRVHLDRAVEKGFRIPPVGGLQSGGPGQSHRRAQSHSHQEFRIQPKFLPDVPQSPDDDQRNADPILSALTFLSDRLHHLLAPLASIARSSGIHRQPLHKRPEYAAFVRGVFQPPFRPSRPYLSFGPVLLCRLP